MNLPALSSRPAKTLSLEQRSTNAKAMLARMTTAAEASKAATQLAGQFASLRAHDPDGFIWAVAAVLGKYPFGVVEECCDPQRGLALKIEFLSIKSLGEYCDGRLEFYRSLAAYKGIAVKAELPDDPVMAERIGSLLRDLGNTLRARITDGHRVLVEKAWGPVKPWDGEVSPELARTIRGEPQSEPAA